MIQVIREFMKNVAWLKKYLNVKKDLYRLWICNIYVSMKQDLYYLLLSPPQRLSRGGGSELGVGRRVGDDGKSLNGEGSRQS